MMDVISVVFAIVVLIAYFVLHFVLKKEIASVTMEKEVREAVLSLFLYAEKQGWTGQAKMAYVSYRIHYLVPGAALKSVIKEEDINSYLQKMYDLFKDSLR